MRIIAIILKVRPIRDLLVVSIDIKTLRGCGLAAQVRSDIEKEKRYACNESGAI
jgi:hypothetical protein